MKNAWPKLFKDLVGHPAFIKLGEVVQEKIKYEQDTFFDMEDKDNETLEVQRLKAKHYKEFWMWIETKINNSKY